MKKFVFGCLGVLVLAAIAGGVAAYFVFQRAKTTLLTYSASVTQLQEIPRIEAQVRNKAEFTAPATGELTEDQVARLVAVQQTIKDRLGARVKELDAKYEALSKAHGGNSSISDGLEALKDLGSLVLDAKKVQVDALNAQRFSLAEYRLDAQVGLPGRRRAALGRLRRDREEGAGRHGADQRSGHRRPRRRGAGEEQAAGGSARRGLAAERRPGVFRTVRGQ